MVSEGPVALRAPERRKKRSVSVTPYLMQIVIPGTSHCSVWRTWTIKLIEKRRPGTPRHF